MWTVVPIALPCGRVYRQFGTGRLDI